MGGWAGCLALPLHLPLLLVRPAPFLYLGEGGDPPLLEVVVEGGGGRGGDMKRKGREEGKKHGHLALLPATHALPTPEGGEGACLHYHRHSHLLHSLPRLFLYTFLSGRLLLPAYHHATTCLPQHLLLYPTFPPSTTHYLPF